MSADETDGRPAGPAPFIGFHAYADDTLRDAPNDPPESGAETVRREPRDQWPGPRRRRSGRGGGVALLALALVVGAAVAVSLNWAPLSRQALLFASSDAPVPALRPRLQVELPPAPEAQHSEPAPLAAPPALAPPALAMTLRSAPAAAPPLSRPLSSRPEPRRMASPLVGAPQPRDFSAVARDVASAARADDTVPATPPAPAPPQASFDCRFARTPAQRMVCEDPELAAADRRLSQAYRAAVAAGAPEEDLRDEQQDWLSLREDAARRSRRALADVYEQRIGDLERQREAASPNPQP
ncbi:MAG: hypothetical protein JWP23_778 [Phenylobacterium sp.]|nr:hypothetical protein [Phenylobacterium sp.]